MKEKNIITIDEPEITLEQYEGKLNITTKNCHIYFKKENSITGLSMIEQATLTIHLEEQASLKWSDFWTHQNTNCHIIVYSSNETKLEWNLNIEAKSNYNILLENQILGQKNESKINIHVVALENYQCKIKSVGIIAEKTKDNQLIEELKGLTLANQNITFFPDLIVRTNAVKAIHNATIKCINKEELFYLKTKGIDELTCKELIKNGFLKKKM